MPYKSAINIDYDPENAFWLHSKRPDGLEKPEITALLSEWLEKQRRAYHDHEGAERLHPVAVKDHQKYFSEHVVGEAKPEITKPQIDESVEKLVRHRQIANHLHKNRTFRLSKNARLKWLWHAQKMKISSDVLKKKTVDVLTPLIENADIWVRTPVYSLQKILQDKRLKTIGETKKMSPGKPGPFSKYLRERLQSEENLFGEFANIVERPVYGYLSDDRDGHGPGIFDNVLPFGSVAIKLKPTKRNNSTVTIGDSLDDNMNTQSPDIVPAFLDDLKPEIILAGVLDFGKNYYSILELPIPYSEVQIHDGVSVEDIDEIVFHESPNEALVKTLNRAGIKNRAIERTEIGRPAKRGER